MVHCVIPLRIEFGYKQIKQGFLDYLICFFLEGLRPRKIEKKSAIGDGRFSRVTPAPSLNNIVKAKLAATWCGLTKGYREYIAGMLCHAL